ncbi:hypothetical protein KWH48_09385 [Xanthomonas campestris pv. euphorbiae]|nr:hypothetical protein [Xanthomonas campestris pv. euphorbiae]
MTSVWSSRIGMVVLLVIANCFGSIEVFAAKLTSLTPLEQSRAFYQQLLAPTLTKNLTSKYLAELETQLEEEMQDRWKGGCPEMRPAIRSELEKQMRPSLQELFDRPWLGDTMAPLILSATTDSQRLMIATALDTNNRELASFLMGKTSFDSVTPGKVDEVIALKVQEAMPGLVSRMNSIFAALRPITDQCDARLTSGTFK